MAKTEEEIPSFENIGKEFGKFDLRRLTYPAALFPLVVLFGLSAVDELDRAALAVILPNIRDWFGLSIFGVTLLTAATLPLGLLLELPVAYYADRVNRVRLAVIGAAVWTFFCALSGMALNIVLFAVARVGTAVGRVFNATHRSLLSDYYPSQTRARVFYGYSLSPAIAQTLGPLIAGALTAAFVWRTPFFVFAIPCVLFIALALRLKEPTRGVNERLEAGATVETAQVEDDAPTFSETFRVLFANKSAKRIYYSLPFLTASTLGFGTFLSLFYSDIYHIGPFGRGVIFAGVEPVQIAGLIFGGVFLQKYVNKSPGLAMKLLGVAAVGVSLGLIVLALSPNVEVALAGHFFLSFASSTILPGTLAVISFVIPPRMRTLGFATGNLWILLGVPVIPIIGGIGDHFGLRVGILIFVPVYLLGSLLLASAGFSIEEDIERVQGAARAQAEMRKSREEGSAKLLICRDLDVAYDNVQVLFGVDFEVTDGEIVALLGTNGAGKSTLLKAISGLLPAAGGTVLFDGRVITNADPVQVAHLGIAQIPGGRAVFPTLTVEENIRVAGWMFRGDEDHLKEATERILEHFPVLRERWHTAAGDMSGGEQQMLSLAQAFIAQPKLLLIDELTLGLSPTIVAKLLEIVNAIHAQGTTIVLVEQSVNIALKLAQRAVFMEKGEVRFSGPTRDLLDRPDVLRSVFLEGAAGNAAHAHSQAHHATRSERSEIVLQAEGVTKTFGGITAVDNVDIKLHDGEILGIIGPNGAGKTTFFDLLTGFQTIDEGRITLHGEDVTHLPAYLRTKQGLGRSFQDARLWSSLTVIETISVAFERSIGDRNPMRAMLHLPIVKEAEKDVHRRAEELIELLGLQAFRDKFVSELSTGSRRIVEIAAILAHRPSVLLLDEPSSGIAQKETEALGPLLRRVREYMDGSLIVVEHNVPLINTLADRIVAMDLGRVIADGPPSEVLTDNAVVESYLGATGYEEIAGSLTGNGAKRTRRPVKRKKASARKTR
jgi:ABC-type branched-subunit amino acid transport system ATPase component/predicted MFS family arabinose efflux permease